MQWVGGMGIIILSLAIFPALGIGSFHLFKAEIPGGVTVDRVQPRLAETAKILWKTYIALTLLEIVVLRILGLDFFDAVTHTFSTVATGGFLPVWEKCGLFDNVYVEAAIFFFMFLGGINFVLHFQLLRETFGKCSKILKFDFTGGMLITGILIATWGLYWNRLDDGFGSSFRSAAFTVMSVNTTTDFATDDFNQWPDFLKMMLLTIMLVGGCSALTSGSLKAIRIIAAENHLQRIEKADPSACHHARQTGR